MRAITYREHGGPDVLELTEVPTPEPSGKEVLVRVRAAGVNPFDFKVRAGAIPGLPSKFPSTPGSEIAGVVEAAGPDAEFAVGDEVFGWSSTGGYAEYALGWKLARKPEGLSWADAVAIPIPGEAATRALGLLDLKAGETLLVHGGSGNVGGFAVQLAASRGVTVVGTSAPGDEEIVGDRGGIGVAFGDGLVERVRAVAPRVDAVLDAAGHGAVDVSLELLEGPIRLVSLVDPKAAEVGGIFTTTGSPNPAELIGEIADLVATGKMKMLPAREFPLAQAAQAQAAGEAGSGVGKIVLIP